MQCPGAVYLFMSVSLDSQCRGYCHAKVKNHYSGNVYNTTGVDWPSSILGSFLAGQHSLGADPSVLFFLFLFDQPITQVVRPIDIFS